jgi:hypothetical protein
VNTIITVVVPAVLFQLPTTLGNRGVAGDVPASPSSPQDSNRPPSIVRNTTIRGNVEFLGMLYPLSAGIEEHVIDAAEDWRAVVPHLPLMTGLGRKRRVSGEVHHEDTLAEGQQSCKVAGLTRLTFDAYLLMHTHTISHFPVGSQRLWSSCTVSVH